MDSSEEAAHAYLVYLGFKDIVYEPDGKVPPDFLVEGRIAVEVRRLNQNEQTASGFRGLEVVAIPFQMKVRRLLMSLGPPRSGASWYVHYNFRRPIPIRDIMSELRQRLIEFRDGDSGTLPAAFIVGTSLEVRLCRAPRLHGTFFVPGGFSDDDSGGWVFGETQKKPTVVHR